MDLSTILFIYLLFNFNGYLNNVFGLFSTSN